MEVEFDVDSFEMQVLNRRKSGMIFEILLSKQSSKLHNVKIPVARKCGYSQDDIIIPVRNTKCPRSECIWELENLSTILSIKCIDGKTYECLFCKTKVNIDDYYYDVDIAYYTKLLPDAPLYIDRSGNFSAELSVMSIAEKEIIIKQLEGIQPMNPCIPEKIDLDYLENTISQFKAIMDICERNLSKLGNLYNSAKSIEVDRNQLEKDLVQLLKNKIHINLITKEESEKVFTFWLSNKDSYTQISLYYPSLNKWYTGELYNTNNTQFKMLDKSTHIGSKSGNIYIIGGAENQKTISCKTFEIQVKLNEKENVQKFYVHEKQPLPQEHLFHQYCEMDNKIYVMLGLYTDWKINRDLHRMECEVYDIINGTWSKIKCASFPRAFGSSCSTGSNSRKLKKLYLFGGLKCEFNRQMTDVRQIEEYDIAKDVWTELFNITDLNLLAQKIALKQMNVIFCSNEQELIIFGGNFIDRNRVGRSQNEGLSAFYTINFNIFTKSLVSDENLPNSTKVDSLSSFPYNYAYLNDKIYIYYLSTETGRIIDYCFVYDMKKQENKWGIISKESSQRPNSANTVSNSQIKLFTK